ncbi:membrane alanyl aminopeptidase [Amyelois transitella]|uniref:membrane alanyl aminopeptidase n=1 Tax=Amyelois transitella TaxID=680683 RepID=UPI00067AA5C2|nr:membrane alanyl aminopeptidase [Amyelois transitella]
MSKTTLFSLVLFLAFARGDFHQFAWGQPYWVFDIPEMPEVITRGGEQAYRLPKTVVPIIYDIYIHLFFDENEDSPFTYDGWESIIIQATAPNVTHIILHSNVDFIKRLNLYNEQGSPVRLNPILPFQTEPSYHFLIINLLSPLIVGVNYTLHIGYSGSINEGPMKKGIWRGWYIDDEGNERIYVTTHFQPYMTRQAFPCWDEPEFKAAFRLHLSAPRSYRGTFSNTGVEYFNFIGTDRIIEHFRLTPKMSPYLVTFLVSETFQVIAENSSFTPPIRIIGRSNIAGLGDHALDLVVKMTTFYDEYFQMPYSTLHENLTNDHVISPDWESAGTENWGMVSYRELFMIIDPRETIMSTEQYSATLASHELAHIWFGNLVTCQWWNNTWMNEGFASYFGYIGANEMFPEYRLDEQFNSRYLKNTLDFDSRTWSSPLNHAVYTPEQVTNNFGTISYSKGAVFVRMTADIITQETFRKACRYFLERNKFKPADQYDLLNAFSDAITEDNSLSIYQHFNFTEYYRVWVNEPGYPILNVNVNHVTGEMALHQQRFFISANTKTTGRIYPIPITYSTARSADFENIRPIYMMSSERAVLNKTAGEEWVIFNHLQHGLYRVNYDDRTWDLIAEALRDTPIHHLNRAQIVEDVFALMRSGRMTHSKGFYILQFLQAEINYHVWYVAINGYSWLRERLGHLPESLAEFDSYILGYMQNVIEAVDFEPSTNEEPTVSLTRQEVLQFACALGHKACVEDSISRFLAMRNGTWIDPRIRKNVYMTGIRHGSTEDFDFLMNRLLNSNYANDQSEMLRGLASTTSPQLLLRYLNFTLTRDVRSHDKFNAFGYALVGDQESALTVLEFVKNNIDAIRVEYIEDAPLKPVHKALEYLAEHLNEKGLNDYENWLRTTQSKSLQYGSALSSIAMARGNLAWGTANAEDILTAARGGAVTVATSITLLIVMAFISTVV